MLHNEGLFNLYNLLTTDKMNTLYHAYFLHNTCCLCDSKHQDEIFGFYGGEK
jgi:hypothetical protein